MRNITWGRTEDMNNISSGWDGVVEKTGKREVEEKSKGQGILLSCTVFSRNQSGTLELINCKYHWLKSITVKDIVT